MTLDVCGAPRDRPTVAARKRDPRIDVLRGLSLLTIFVDHIPANCLSRFTLHCFGFSDAAEIFVFLAGYSGFTAYAPVFERSGLWAGLRKVSRRCLVIWGAHAGLLLATLAIVTSHWSLTGIAPTFVAPLLRDGLTGIVRGLTLQAMPRYLDILPLYIVLLFTLPLIVFGFRRSVLATLALSVGVYVLANCAHYNLPNQIDDLSTSVWTFNPLTWQLIFVAGAAFAAAGQTGASWLAKPSIALTTLCVAYLAFGFLTSEDWIFWPPLFRVPLSLLGNEPKSFATPWRVMHGLALLFVVLTCPGFKWIADRPAVEKIAACGRRSLTIFSAGCILALLGRLAVRDFGSGLLTQLLINIVGLLTLLALPAVLEGWSRSRMKPSPPILLGQEA